MKKKLLIRCAVGFLLGIAAMYIVPSVINRCPENCRPTSAVSS